MEKASKVWKYFHKSPQNKDKVTIGFISTLNYSFTIRTIRILGTEYHYSVFVFGPFSKPKYIRYSVFGPFSKPEHIRYSVFGQNLLFGPTLFLSTSVKENFFPFPT